MAWLPKTPDDRAGCGRAGDARLAAHNAVPASDLVDAMVPAALHATLHAILEICAILAILEKRNSLFPRVFWLFGPSSHGGSRWFESSTAYRLTAIPTRTSVFL